MKSTKRLLVPLLALSATALTLAASDGCSLVVDPQSKQCSNDADCTGLGAGFEGTFCNADSVCQNNLEYCSTNQQCQDRTKVGTYVCRQSDNRCIDLLTAECPKLLADPGDLLKDPLILGTVAFPGEVPQLLAGENVLEMARLEFKNNAGGLPGASRPVVVVACDASIRSPDQHKLATDHLIDVVGVPILIGVVPASWANYALTKARAKDTLILTPGADTLNANSEERRGILFRNNFNQVKTIKAETTLIDKVLEAKVRAEKGLTPDQPIRIAMVYSNEGSSAANGAIFFENVRFNGKTAAENGDNYKQFNIGDPTAPDFNTTFSNAVLDIAAFQPHIVVVYDGAATPDVPIQIEAQFPGFTHFIVEVAGNEARAALAFGNDETKRRRFWLVQSGKPSTDRNYAQFIVQYEATFRSDVIKGPVAGVIGAPQYDFFYLAMYALVANAGNEKPFSGRALGQTILTRLRGGPNSADVQMGPLYIDDAVQKLQRGENILYYGAATTSQFDDNGDINTPNLILCISKDQSLGDRFIETTMYVDENDQLIGTDNCD